MIKIAICDDEFKFTSKLDELLNEIARKKGIRIEIDVYFDGFHLVEAIEKNNICYDIIFLDIEMNHMNGLETAKRIRKQDEIVLLIYVTSHSSYAIEAYEVHPFQFILKPINEEIVCRYFMKAYEKIISDDFYYEYKYRNDYFKVLMKDIMYFKSEKRVIKIYLYDGRIKTYYDKLNSVEEKIKTKKLDFWRIHQSILVNAKYIVRKAYDHVELTDNTKLYISEDRRKIINEIYVKTIEGELSE
ncbi:MAG: response regulator transcription factor [Lachnospiraceae bacterium]|nr:response regulator transcription factor [Lachnospiraceae bacterium]